MSSSQSSSTPSQSSSSASGWISGSRSSQSPPTSDQELSGGWHASTVSPSPLPNPSPSASSDQIVASTAPWSTVPSQSLSMPSHTSVAPGWMEACRSSQSSPPRFLATTPSLS